MAKPPRVVHFTKASDTIRWIFWSLALAMLLAFVVLLPYLRDPVLRAWPPCALVLGIGLARMALYHEFERRQERRFLRSGIYALGFVATAPKYVFGYLSSKRFIYRFFVEEKEYFGVAVMPVREIQGVREETPLVVLYLPEKPSVNMAYMARNHAKLLGEKKK